MKIPRMGRTCLVAKLFIICLLWTCHNHWSLGLYLRQLLHALMYIYSKSVHTNAYINILRCFGYPREHNFGFVLILSPTGCTEGCVYFPQSCRNTHLPHFLDCLLNTTLIPCLLVCFLSILHERVCDYSGVQSSATGILRMGDMNIHITWLTHVRTGPKKKNRAPASLVPRPHLYES